jgi:hypothetical protein
MIRYVAILLLLGLTSCDQAISVPAEIQIESPLRNVCQSGDLASGFPKCEMH